MIAGTFRFCFYSFDCNEPRHVHVQSEDRLCKFWLEPVTLAKNAASRPASDADPQPGKGAPYI